MRERRMLIETGIALILALIASLLVAVCAFYFSDTLLKIIGVIVLGLWLMAMAL